MAKTKSASPNVLTSAKVPTIDARGDYSHHSVSVRKIANGYIVSTSKDDGKDFSHTEEFTPKRPNIGVKALAPGKSRDADDAPGKSSSTAKGSKAVSEAPEGSAADRRADAKGRK
jgi:hypothetical protein